jgi:hypothetical protein
MRGCEGLVGQGRSRSSRSRTSTVSTHADAAIADDDDELHPPPVTPGVSLPPLPTHMQGNGPVRIRV